MATRLIERAPHLPGFGVCHSPSGYGKTYASIFAQNKLRAARVEVGDSWSRRTLLHNILREFRISARESARLDKLCELAIAALGDDPRRPLIIDEADKLVDKHMIETVRELQEKSGAPVILIGEERLPTKLLQVERMHNRVLSWFAAQPCDIDDARQFAKVYVPKVAIADDLLQAICVNSGGKARRIVVNLDTASEIARNQNLTKLTLAHWGDQKFYTGEPPPPRPAEDFKHISAKGAA
ncbi:AAA family ATPase [Afipia sp. P52-10]|uniref:AAA family ATPase n=1 Tax=Afipia sp. P52-10 TaxID=1429916 RepID=UPI001FCC637B|nr:ATP-binding protein [Afipia sp. P52-10]